MSNNNVKNKRNDERTDYEFSVSNTDWCVVILI